MSFPNCWTVPLVYTKCQSNQDFCFYITMNKSFVGLLINKTSILKASPFNKNINWRIQGMTFFFVAAPISEVYKSQKWDQSVVKQAATPVAMVWQGHCTWSDSVLFNVSVVKLYKDSRPLCLDGVSASCTSDLSVQFMSKISNYCWSTALLKILTKGSLKQENALLAK